MKSRIILLAVAAFLSGSCAVESENIRIDQVGFYPSQEKTLTLEQDNPSETVSIYRAGRKVWEGEAVRTAESPWSGKERRVFDFSEISRPGTYTVKAGSEKTEFTVSENAFDALAEAALKGFYHQRSGMDLDPAVAGKWARRGGHPDTLVFIHASAASEGRPEGTVISSPKGWYDAGDYNKYVVNSGYSMGLMAEAALMFSTPEDSDRRQAIHEELKYNAEWLYTMQDPSDGGVYHKLTNPEFEGFISPLECSKPRYVVQKSVTAALDFAGALCSFVELGDSPDPETIAKAEAAYAWAASNPSAFYFQERMNRTYDPDVSTGAYGDGSASDEFFWAASCLYRATGKTGYLEDVKRYMPESFSVMSWGNVSALGVFEWLRNGKNGVSADEQEIYERCLQMLLEYCDRSMESAETSCYNSPYGNSPRDFYWGCASTFCDQSVCFLYAYKLTGKAGYLKNAFRNVNYILGQNATGYCYVTGFGSKSPMFPHSRLCHSDGVVEPIPGLLVGGPNPGHNDKAEVTYSSSYPDESYEDVMPSYASNEIAINWNASLVAAVTWLAEIAE
ncbi:MAG: hypothetical protein E7113_01715 [Bacteroidales bacterium]|nr:hypothetical protein [Bacteroidales bacterium]